MTAVWCDPSQLYTLPCGCVARQCDAGCWHPLRACLAHATFEIRVTCRTPVVYCRCCAERLNILACHCEPHPCLRCGGTDQRCAAHCQCDNPDAPAEDPWADGQNRDTRL